MTSHDGVFCFNLWMNLIEKENTELRGKMRETREEMEGKRYNRGSAGNFQVQSSHKISARRIFGSPSVCERFDML